MCITMVDEEVQHLAEYKREKLHLTERLKTMTKLIADLEAKGVKPETDISTASFIETNPSKTILKGHGDFED